MYPFPEGGGGVTGSGGPIEHSENSFLQNMDCSKMKSDM